MEIFRIDVKSENSFLQYKLTLQEEGDKCKVQLIELMENGISIDYDNYFEFVFNEKPFKVE